MQNMHDIVSFAAGVLQIGTFSMRKGGDKDRSCISVPRSRYSLVLVFDPAGFTPAHVFQFFPTRYRSYFMKGLTIGSCGNFVAKEGNCKKKR
jgi:hypothetical protein